MTCQTCGRENRSDARFCDGCGHRFLIPAGSSGERRQLTVLFCDIVDSTPLTEHTDEEDWPLILASYRKRVTAVVARWGGEVDFYAGDGVCAYFGYPHAHEDDAERAVRAALDIIAAIGEADAADKPAIQRIWATMRLRVGVHTGPVVIADLGTDEEGDKQPLGSTMNEASRLQAAAPPGAVVMSDATERLVNGRFATEDLGTPKLKGVADAIRAYLVKPSAGRDDGRDARTITPLVGRDHELATLHACWEQACTGHIQAVLVSGEAGIGKSRLVRHFMDDVVARGDVRTFSWRCSPFHTTTPFYPLIGSLEQQLGLQRGTAPRSEIAARVNSVLATMGVSADPTLNLKDVAAAITDLLEGLGGARRALADTPLVRRSRTLQVLCDLAIVLARSRPTVLLVEDLHWADASTLELLGLFFSCATDVPLIVLLTTRPDFTPPWAGSAAVQKLTLDALPPDACAELFDALVGDRAFPAAVRTEVLARADGIPLFIEELTRTVLDSAGDSTGDVLSTIPDTLRGLLVSRLDRLSAGALDTIHLASALSRQFRFDLLAAVSAKPAEALRKDLDELVRVGLVFRSHAAAGDTYTFKHALVADAAYDSILRSDRRRLHGQIANRLADEFPNLFAEQPEILAHHLGEAGEIKAAAEQWHRAGDNAVAKGAYQEAIQHLDRGLKLVGELEAGRERLQLEIELTTSKGTALFSTLGYSHPLVESTFARALELCERDGIKPTLLVLYGLWAHNVTRSNRDAVDALLPRFQELAARTGDSAALLVAHANTGMRAFYYGRFEECLEEMTTATQWYGTADHSAFMRRIGYFGSLYTFAVRMWTLSILGRKDEAFAADVELAELAEQAANPYGLAIAMGYRLSMARDRRDPVDTVRLADRQIEFTKRQMLPMWEGAAHCSRGWARAHLGQTAEGIAEIRLGLQYLDAVGLRASYPYHLSALVEALLLTGEVETALSETRRALTMSQTGLDRFCEADLLRLEGECLRRLGQLDAAEERFRQALALARAQSARFFASRAADGLMSLLVAQGRGELARSELASVLGEIAGAV